MEIKAPVMGQTCYYIFPREEDAILVRLCCPLIQAIHFLVVLAEFNNTPEDAVISSPIGELPGT